MNDIPKWHERHLGLLFAMFNCWQLICRVYKSELGIVIPTYNGLYDMTVKPEEVAKLIEFEKEQWVKVGNIRQAKPFDVLVFWVTNPRDPSHMGVYVHNKTMLTTRRSTGSRLEHVNEWVRDKRLHGIWRHPDLVESSTCPNPNSIPEDSKGTSE